MNPLRFIVLVVVVGAWELRAADGWTDLFNGKNLSGWTEKAGDAKFFLDDGCTGGEAVSERDTNSVLLHGEALWQFYPRIGFQSRPPEPGMRARALQKHPPQAGIASQGRLPPVHGTGPGFKSKFDRRGPLKNYVNS